MSGPIAIAAISQSLRQDEVVELFRVKLGLLPWSEYAATSPSPPGRTGRTTLGLLQAFAGCLSIGARRLYIEGANVETTVGYAHYLVFRLSLDIEIKRCRDRRGRERGACLYVDHHQADRRHPVDHHPDRQPVWLREYLGHWFEGPDYGSEPSRSVVVTKCARCELPIDPADPQAHHAVCAGPPIKAGDYVRWWPDGEGDGKRWCAGKAISVRDGIVWMMRCETYFGKWSTQWPRGTMAQPQLNPGVIRRIDYPGSNGGGYLCGLGSGGAQALPPQPVAHPEPHPPPALAAAPTAARELYDGIDATQCYWHWVDNRALVERGGTPLYLMTPAQIAVGRRAYQSDALHALASDLRARVEASDAADRARPPSVVIDLDLEYPW
jgi:hypothetical protein